MTTPQAIYNQALADLEKLALDHGISREQGNVQSDSMILTTWLKL